MKAIVYTTYGAPDVLQLQEVEKPTPKDDEALIKVQVASVNPLDWWPQNEIAAYVGSVRDVIGRSLKELRDRQLIEMNRSTIRILDEVGLRMLIQSG